MSLLAALGAVLAHFTTAVHPGASVLVHIENDAWAALKAEADQDPVVADILANVVQEMPSAHQPGLSVGPDTHTKVQFAAGDWQALRAIHDEQTAPPVMAPVVAAPVVSPPAVVPPPVVAAPVVEPVPPVIPINPVPPHEATPNA